MLTAAQARMARGALDLTIRQLAEKAELHHNTISRIENGERVARGTLLVLQEVFERAGIVFIPENGGGAGVRLRERAKEAPG